MYFIQIAIFVGKSLLGCKLNVSPWPDVREGLLLQGFLQVRFGGLIFGRAYFQIFFGGGLLSEFYSISSKWKPFYLL